MSSQGERIFSPRVRMVFIVVLDPVSDQFKNSL